MIYFEGFKDQQDIVKQYEMEAEALEGASILFAYYNYENYSGKSFVLYQKDGELFEVNGDHCSCYGLEGQWNPEETSMYSLMHRFFMEDRTPGFGKEADQALHHIVFNYIINKAIMEDSDEASTQA